jgi:DNA invertase Pin-like site-specific DNA recombinase
LNPGTICASYGGRECVTLPRTLGLRSERSLIRERQREGIAIAKKAGIYKGRKHTLTTEQAAILRFRAKTEKKAALAREFGISRETVYQYLATVAR